MGAPESRSAAAGLDARPLGRRERDTALRHLARDARSNLFLLDLTERMGSRPPPGEMSSEVIGVWRGGEIVGVAGVRPSIVFDGAASQESVDALLPYLDDVGVGLVKSAPEVVGRVWDHLSRDGRRRVILDRRETSYAVRASTARLEDARPGESIRTAKISDLDDLVVAARESLQEEDRPDPFIGDPRGFRRWVRGRVERARIVESQGRVVFVGYADVRRPEGWLIQGVYTWPERRRRGFGRAGISQLCRDAFQAGADHVQLAVVEGNEPGRGLYERLGFEPFAELRTILFTYS
jgi:ribosomal protein S18 acetylase RimI-like enzyme